MKTLQLNLIKRWFDLTYSGVKKEEYREIKAYWCNRFLQRPKGEEHKGEFNFNIWKYIQEVMGDNFEEFVIECVQKGLMVFKTFETTTFSNGMTPPVPRFEIEQITIDVGYGVESWGAELGKIYFIIKHGELVEDGCMC